MSVFGVTGNAPSYEGIFTGTSDFFFVGGDFSGGTITQLVSYCNDRAGSPSFNDCDFAIYSGGSSSGPDGASLLWNSKYYNAVTLGSASLAWCSIVDSSDDPPNVVAPAGWLWIVLRSNDGIQQACSGAADEGDFAAIGETRFVNGTGDLPGQSWPTTFTGNGANYFAVMSIQLTYSVGDGPSIRRVARFVGGAA